MTIQTKAEPLPGKPLVDTATRELIRRAEELADAYDVNLEMDLLLIKDLYGDGPDPADD